MSGRTPSEAIDVQVFLGEGGQWLCLSVAPGRTVGELLRVAAARFHVLDEQGRIGSLSIRRERETAVIDHDLACRWALLQGDRLIIEVSAWPLRSDFDRDEDAFEEDAP